ncbi:MAG TPA: M10 family metallopeptidase C-terminal domain-containing protein, partial [Tepidisphaeraceae bacterium]|nr:M10 family metallopeptidase C-terminal domain-containing protein [Tepidisphaeraceae bacterium]
SVNNGIVEADVSGKTLSVQGVITNKGVFRASHGATMSMTAPVTFTNQGAIAAEGGTVLIGGAFNCGAAGIIDIGIGGTGQGTSYGLINVTGALTLGGTINTYLTGVFKPANGASFTPIKYTNKTGTFATSNFNAGGGVAFTPTFGGTSLSIKASTAASSVASVSAGKLTLNGTSAADVLSVTDSLGVVTATRGGVTSVFSTGSITGINISGGDGADTITYTGNTIPSTLAGGNGDDKITGSNASDVLSGDAGNDTEIGGAGNDRYLFAAAASAETDLIGESSGGGNDTLDFSAMTTSVVIKLNSDTLATMTNRTVKTQTAGQFANIEHAIGGSGNDTITGNAAANNLQGGAGNDTFFAQDGTTAKDSIDGGLGTDVVSTKDASDVVTNVP